MKKPLLSELQKINVILLQHYNLYGIVFYMRIDRNSPTPLYYQIEQDILERFQNQKLKPGDSLPTEKYLQEQYKVSRTTIRLALNSLFHKGMITRLPGKGTFVSKPRILHKIGTITSFTEEMQTVGIKVSTQILEVKRQLPSQHIANDLQIESNKYIVLLKRLRFANDEAVSINSTYLPEDLIPGFIGHGMNGESLYKMLEETYHLELVETDETVEAVLITDDEAKLLNVPQGFPGLLVGRITYTKDERPVERAYTLYRGDKFTYYAKLRGRASISSLI